MKRFRDLKMDNIKYVEGEQTMNNIREEAIKRTETLVNTFGLNPNILKYLKGGQVYYSYTIFMGASASIDKISYDKEYEKAVQDFETEHNSSLRMIKHNWKLFSKCMITICLLKISTNSTSKISTVISRNHPKQSILISRV